MPTQTFFNLPEEKKNRIIRAAIQEFAAYSFDQASIAHIIESAGIPRGSFYQYFENLKDIYKYIINLAGEQKIKYFQATVPQFEGKGFDFFSTLRDLCIAGFQFAKENPELLAIGNNFIKETNKSLRNEILGEQLPKAKNFYEFMLQKGIELGQINPQIDPQIATLFMGAWSTAFTELYLAELKNLGPENAEDLCALLTNKQFLQKVDQMIDLLANGLATRHLPAVE